MAPHQHLKGLKREETDRISVLYPFLPLELYPFLPYRNLESGKICCTFAPEITFNLNGESLNKGGIISRRFISISASEAFCPAGCADLLGNGRALMIPLRGGLCGRPVGRQTEYLYLPFGKRMATLLYIRGGADNLG